MNILGKYKYTKEYLNKENYIMYIQAFDVDIHDIIIKLYVKLHGEETKVFEYEQITKYDGTYKNCGSNYSTAKVYKIYMLDLGTDGELCLDAITKNGNSIGRIKITLENKDGVFFSQITEVNSSEVNKLLTVETGRILTHSGGKRYYKLKMLKTGG